MGSEENKKHLFCFGYGYSCERLGDTLLKDGDWKVSGTTRDLERKAELNDKGVCAHLFDDGLPLMDPFSAMHGVTHLLISTPPSGAGDPSFDMHAEDILRLRDLEWVGYLSTTGPYGDRGGDWVDENSRARPTTKRGERRYRIENSWLDLLKKHNLPVHIFRLSGIYGPGRSALESVRTGVARRVDKPGFAFSRVHVDDIVQVLRASIKSPNAGEIYNICDDTPTPSHEVIDCACEMLGIEPPPLVPFNYVDLAPITQSFYADNKRIRNDKIKNDLGVHLRYKSFKDGLQACMDEESEESKDFYRHH